MKLTFLNQLLKPPVFEDQELNQRAKLLHQTLVLGILLSFTVFFASLIAFPDLKFGNSLVGGILLIQLISFPLLQRGFVRQVNIFVAVSIWIVFFIAMFYSNGIHSPVVLGQFLVVTLAILFMGWRVGVIFTLLTVLGQLVVTIMGIQDRLPQRILPDSLPFRWIFQTAYLILNAFVVNQIRTSLEKSLKEARQDEQRYHALFESTTDIVLLLDLNLIILEANQRAKDLLDYPDDQIIGLKLERLVGQHGYQDMRVKCARLLAGEAIPFYEQTFITRTGQEVAVEVSSALVYDSAGTPLTVQSIGRDITNRKQLEDHLRASLAEMATLSRTDVLTGLLNRRAIVEFGELELARSLRDGDSLSFILLDIDLLKDINDSFGHQAGDAALAYLAKKLDKWKRPYDRVGRWGGDEFLVILPGTNLDQAKDVAERLRSHTNESLANLPHGAQHSVRISMGVASLSTQHSANISLDTMLAQADQALYTAKRQGRDRVCAFES
ncbi:MAG: sensor domain-containing diguanylate cyclase [Anaerolineae bacterium]|nr:sensor domain-containing diguanylate cyclase [Anaerolineae bacterium]